MTPDQYQQAWRADSEQTQVTIDMSVLTAEVLRSEDAFQTVIHSRDRREVRAALTSIPVFLFMGYVLSLPWSWYLAIPAQLWVAGYILVDRRRHPQRPSGPGESLLFYAKESLGHVEHQIWLLRNVFWWYLLPSCISCGVFFLHLGWNMAGSWWGGALFALLPGGVVFIFDRGIYRLNQAAVRDALEPQRQNLVRLINNLEGECNVETCSGNENENGNDDHAVSGDLMEIVAELNAPWLQSAKNATWSGGWNQIIPSWREAGVIILATLGGALCGLFSGLFLRIPEMGPVFFQTVVGGVLSFEVTLGWYIWPFIKKLKQLHDAAESGEYPACVPSTDSVDEHSNMLARAPALVIFVLAVFMGIMAVLAFGSFMSQAGSPWSATNAERPTEPEFGDVSAFTEAETATVDAWLQGQADRVGYPSLTAVVVRDGRTVHGRSFGFEDVKLSKPAILQTQYHVASVTKVFTASLAVMLQQQGVISLDDPVAKYLPASVKLSTTPDVGTTITLRQLASHTSGVPGRVHSVDGWYDLEPQRLYDLLADVELETAPGTKKEYSNLGFGLLGHALERAAGKPFDRLLHEMICGPLNMTRTAIPTDDQLHPATGYDDSGRNVEKTHSVRERLAGSGGLVTSAEDLAKFLNAQMQPGVFTREMLKLLQTRTRLADGSVTGTALGWSLGIDMYIGNFLHKNGGRSNCSAWIGFSPKHKVGVAVLTNCGGPEVDQIGRWLLVRSVPDACKPVTKLGHSSVAPFSAVRWEQGRPVVRVDDQWWPLLSIDDISVDRIMDFANREYGEKSRDRFCEDIMEVLAKIGHIPPDWTVTLKLQSDDGQIRTQQVRLTTDNRRRAWLYNNSR